MYMSYVDYIPRSVLELAYLVVKKVRVIPYTYVGECLLERTFILSHRRMR